MCSGFVCLLLFFFFKQKTAYEMRISDWSSDVCSSDLQVADTLTGTASKSEAARPVSIQIHEETNALIITAAPTVFRELSSVIEQLDIRRAQVMVEAAIAEVSDDLADELGVQFQFTRLDTRADGSVGNGVLGGPYLPNRARRGIPAASTQHPPVGRS